MAASLTAPKVLTLGSGPGDLTGTKAAPLKAFRVTVGAAATSDVVVDAQATYQILSVPAGVIIREILFRVITGFSTSVTMTLGDGNDVDGFAPSTDIAPTVAETAGIYYSTAESAGGIRDKGIKYLAADTIDLVIAGATPAAGLMEFIFIYADAAAGTT